ncbi:hypothetical protein BKA03_003028 [Demequina lutea]|uniref:Uncharacterized protein n=1 Tax=Demequina lutea TaxID=431489 RepID=A0A7Z0CJC2_9MICO|nr:hypothetical protein [Demequina lutea]
MFAETPTRMVHMDCESANESDRNVVACVALPESGGCTGGGESDPTESVSSLSFTYSASRTMEDS